MTDSFTTPSTETPSTIHKDLMIALSEARSKAYSNASNSLFSAISFYDIADKLDLLIKEAATLKPKAPDNYSLLDS